MLPQKWLMVVLGFLSFNCTMGFAFGSFGPLLSSLETQFAINRATAASAMSLTTLAMGLSSPVIGGMLQKWPLRWSLFLSVGLCGLSFLGLAFVSHFALALLLYGLIGISIATAAVIGPVTLISRWFVSNRGKILAITMLPVFMFLTPIVIARILPLLGRSVVLASMGGFCLVVALLMLLVVERPSSSGAEQARLEDAPFVASEEDGITVRSLMGNPFFWAVSIAIGILAGSGIVFSVHSVAFAMQQGIDPQEAALLFSIYAGAGVPGGLIMGWIVDRIGAVVALTINTLIQAVLWWTMLHSSVPVLLGISVLMGLTGNTIFVVHGAAFSKFFGAANVSRAMGLSYSIKLPFIFAMGPVAGYLFDLSGDYGPAFTVMAAISIVACLCGLLAFRIGQRASASR